VAKPPAVRNFLLVLFRFWPCLACGPGVISDRIRMLYDERRVLAGSAVEPMTLKNLEER
jgi:hypothetical protein